MVRAQSGSEAKAPSNDRDLIAEFRRVEVASVSDALEQISGKRMYMSHHMQPIFTAKFAGFARTVQLKKDEGNKDPEALTGMLEAIDQGSTDSVYVMVVEDGAGGPGPLLALRPLRAARQEDRSRGGGAPTARPAKNEWFHQ